MPRLLLRRKEGRGVLSSLTKKVLVALLVPVATALVKKGIDRFVRSKPKTTQAQ